MSAAATAAGYLHMQRRLAGSDLDNSMDAKSSPQPKPEAAPVRAPKVEYRRRRHYTLVQA